ncbi:MAG TPA: hypothetical protein ACN46X_10070 [Prochlorococcus sp.]
MRARQLEKLVKAAEDLLAKGFTTLIALKTVTTYTSLAGQSQLASNHATVRH